MCLDQKVTCVRLKLFIPCWERLRQLYLIILQYFIAYGEFRVADKVL